MNTTGNTTHNSTTIELQYYVVEKSNTGDKIIELGSDLLVAWLKYQELCENGSHKYSNLGQHWTNVQNSQSSLVKRITHSLQSLLKLCDKA